MSQPAFPGRLQPGDPELSDRQREVFTALVHLHGRAARGVGSERLAAASGLRLSSASVRAVLAELEDLGLIERTRASAARVPTAGGYELFVRALLEPAVLPGHVTDTIDAQLSRSTREVERLLHDASRLLSSITQQLGLALAASLEDEQLAALDLEPLAEAARVMRVATTPGRPRQDQSSCPGRIPP